MRFKLFARRVKLFLDTYSIWATPRRSHWLSKLTFAEERQPARRYRLAAIGYSRPSLIGRVLAETALLNVAGWLVGAASTALLMRFLGESVFRSRGLFLDPFDLDAYAHTIPVPICITLFSVVTIAYRLVKLDPVTIIERR